MNNQTYPQLRVLCFGAGAIGAYIGGSLALRNHGVVFLERPEMAPGLKESGIEIIQNGIIQHLENPQVVTSIDEALTRGPYDIAILAVKSFDTDGLLLSLKPYAAALPVIVCFQNGVENEQKITETMGFQKVMYGTVTTAIGKSGPTQILVEKLRGIGVSSNHSITPAFISALNSAGLNAEPIYHAEGMKWSKLLTNIMSNASSAILNMSPAEVFADPQLYHIERLQLLETLKVMKKAQIPLVDLPGVPLRALMFVIQHLPEWLSRRIVAGSVGKGRGEKMPSFYLDLAAGRETSEVSYLNGAIVRYGELHQVATPVNKALTRILLEIVSKKREWQEFQKNPAALLKEIEKETI